MRQEHSRMCGILLHPTSLPGPGGIGSLGTYARQFVDFLADAGQSVWQVLPLGPTGYGNSPYASLSTFAGNPLLIDLEYLVDDGIVDRSELAYAPATSHRVDFPAVLDGKLRALRQAADRFASFAPAERRDEFALFCDRHAAWLDDYCLFAALKDAHGGRPLWEWSQELRQRRPHALDGARRELADRVHVHRVLQFYFFIQWAALHDYCRQKGVLIMGDVPLFVALDSDAVWAHPELFKVDSDLVPRLVAGVPPDFFSTSGQLWGNPLYDWDVHCQTDFAWWTQRLRHALDMADMLRLDHFRGFCAAWEVPAGETTAARGAWVPGPGDALFDTIRRRMGEIPLVAEDLGIITPDVHELRDRHGLPGMHVLQFGFTASDRVRVYAPHRCRRNSVVYTGTHDNDTTQGWYQTLSAADRELVEEYLQCAGSSVHWAMIRAAYGTVADTAIVPMQDILGAGTEARMNLPGHAGLWWSYRLSRIPGPPIASHLARLVELYERDAAAVAPETDDKA